MTTTRPPAHDADVLVVGVATAGPALVPHLLTTPIAPTTTTLRDPRPDDRDDRLVDALAKAAPAA